MFALEFRRNHESTQNGFDSSCEFFAPGTAPCWHGSATLTRGPALPFSFRRPAIAASLRSLASVRLLVVIHITEWSRIACDGMEILPKAFVDPGREGTLSRCAALVPPQVIYTYPDNPRVHKCLIAAKYNDVEVKVSTEQSFTTVVARARPL